MRVLPSQLTKKHPAEIFRPHQILNGGDIGHEDDVIRLQLLQLLDHRGAAVGAVIKGVDGAEILGQEGHKAIGKGIAQDHTGGRVLQAGVAHHNHGVIPAEHGIFGKDVHPLPIVEEGTLVFPAVVLNDPPAQLPGGTVGNKLIGAKLVGTADPAGETAPELAQVPLLHVGQLHRRHAQGLAGGPIGIVGSQGSPMVIRAEEKILVVVGQQCGDGIHLDDTVVQAAFQIVQDLALTDGVQGFLILLLDHDAHGGVVVGGLLGMVSLSPAMIVIKDSLHSATPIREAQGIYPFGYTFMFTAIETARLRVDRLPTPTGLIFLGAFNLLLSNPLHYTITLRKGKAGSFW